MFANSASEYYRISTAHRCQIRADILPRPIAEDLDSHAHTAVVVLLEFLFQDLHVMSLARPEMPSSPDCVFRSDSTSCVESPSLVAIRLMIAGSRSPERGPITKPSSGVMPIEVSTVCPPRIAAAEQPLPRCSVITCVCSRVSPCKVR